jgi:outer membrane protein OmpA-like peptidoglycan-associated protein
LKAVADTLKQHTEIERIQVQGHTDNHGTRRLNQALSDKRAAAVKQWLINAGVEAKRLESKGFGQDKPIDSNETDSGRQNNRRVQFIILSKSGNSDVETR